MAIPTEAQVRAFAQSVGLAYEIACGYVTKYGQLPPSLQALEAYMNDNGIRNPVNGILTGRLPYCNLAAAGTGGTPPTGATPPSGGTPPTGGTPATGTGGNDLFSQAFAWIEANPLPAILIAVAAGAMLFGGKR